MTCWRSRLPRNTTRCCCPPWPRWVPRPVLAPARRIEFSRPSAGPRSCPMPRMSWRSSARRACRRNRPSMSGFVLCISLSVCSPSGTRLGRTKHFRLLMLAEAEPACRGWVRGRGCDRASSRVPAPARIGSARSRSMWERPVAVVGPTRYRQRSAAASDPRWKARFLRSRSQRNPSSRATTTAGCASVTGCTIEQVSALTDRRPRCLRLGGSTHQQSTESNFVQRDGLQLLPMLLSGP